MEFSSSRQPPSNLDSLAKTLSNILHFRRVTNHPTKYSSQFPKDEQQNPSIPDAMESLLADLFARISSVKAAYAQLQVAQNPYDSDSIRSADLAVVTELQHISNLKHSYLHHHHLTASQSPLLAHLHEQRNLLKTYEITAKKLESELQLKESESISLRAKLNESLHNPLHFLAALRHAVKSIKSFTKLMAKHMESASWDLDAAAKSIQPDVVLRDSSHSIFSFESYVCTKIFSDFHRKDFSLRSLEKRRAWDRRKFFEEFMGLEEGRKAVSLGFERFCREKYLGIVKPKMEVGFFGDLEQRALVRSGRGFPETEWFTGFAEMARRVWALHCLFFACGPDFEAEIFQVRKGCRFSETYMESVVEEERCRPMGRPTEVGFTVMPGFMIGRMVIQCIVYLSD
ncbi:protein GRAVITROPIC IN THE LIGHT 1-like [Typha latifolia]|uniref:protein GRAVITROPIC IN THE LIGHT 1-like n=1 Tax=Typha latifolia TaxID=4733 RepID=UPI003C301E9C